MGNPEHACVNCHFFTYKYKTLVGTNERNGIKENDYKLIFITDQFGCHKGVWQEEETYFERSQEMIDARYKLIVETERNDYFFFEYRPEMGLYAVEELERREALSQSKQSKRKVKSTKRTKAKQTVGKLKRGERKPNIPDKELIPYVKQDLKYLTSPKGGKLKGGDLRKKVMDNIYKKFKDKYGFKANYEEGTVRNLISDIKTGKKVI